VEEKEPSNQNMLIIGANLIALIAYTIYFRAHGKNDEFAFIGVAFFMALQIIICLIAAIFICRKEFLLSALLVLLIGFSTCWAVFFN
jgi:hypothetical protein